MEGGRCHILSTNNSNPIQCVQNLLRITRGECVYDRIKGMDPTLIDKPSNIAIPLMEAEARWLVQTYEPRVDVNSIDMKQMLAEEGGFAINVDASIMTG